MARHFENDLFVSYAHADNSDGWVDTFEVRLQNRLVQLGTAVTVWRDRKLTGSDVFSSEVFDRLKSSALLVTILSPQGIASNWCQDERQKFEQFAQGNGGFRLGNTIRALKVVKTPLDGDAHRPIFGTLGFEFYRRDPADSRFREFHPSSPEYEARLDELAQEIRRILAALRAVPPQPSRPPVFVAAVSADLDPDRARIVQQITDWGYSVVPDAPLRVDSPRLRADIEAALAPCELAVHLVSDKRGVIPEAEDKSVVALQYEMAEVRRKQRVVWLRPDCAMHPAIAAAIEASSQEGLERLERQSIEDLKDVLAAKLRSLDQPPPATNGSGKLNVYVVCDRKDHPFTGESGGSEQALQLKSFLDSRGYAVWLPPVNVPDRRQRDKDHRETLKLSDAVVLYWGAADESWFRENLRELVKARTNRRGHPFMAQAVYFGRPPLNEKHQYRNQLDLVMEQFDQFRPDLLRPFLDRLSTSRSAGAP